MRCRAAGGPKSLGSTDIVGVLSARMFGWTISARIPANDFPFQGSVILTQLLKTLQKCNFKNVKCRLTSFRILCAFHKTSSIKPSTCQ